MESINKVCQKRNVINFLKPPTDRRDKERAWQRRNALQHLVVNEKYKVIYCYIPKVSSTNLKRIFLVLEGLYPSIAQIRNWIDPQLIQLYNRKFTEEQRQYMLKNFYKFTIVRDPFERLASAFLHKFRRKNFKLFASPWERNTNKTKTFIAGHNVSFTAFALHLINNPPWMLDMHWMPYEDLCRPCDVKYDFIGSIDTVSRDVSHVMRQIHANETKYHVKYSSSAGTKTKQTTANLLKELSRKHFDQLLAVYKTDHELFGYPLPEYDTLDKRYTA
jgi:dermatan 4-sulfotransferase 1